MTLEDRPHLGHDLVMRKAGLFEGHRLLDLGAEPCVMRLRVFARGEFGLDGRELGHAGI